MAGIFSSIGSTTILSIHFLQRFFFNQKIILGFEPTNSETNNNLYNLMSQKTHI